MKYITYVSSNGVIFYVANYFNTLCFKYIAISKFHPITYLCIVLTFILSALLLGEPVYFSDLIGAAIIIGFQYYNYINLVGKKVEELPEKETNLIIENES